MQIMYRIILISMQCLLCFQKCVGPRCGYTGMLQIVEKVDSLLATRGGYLLTLWNMATLLVGRSVVISTVEMSKVCFVVDYRATLSLSALLWP